jgi:hypothetical protein
MVDLKVGFMISAVIIMIIMLTMAPIFSGPILAAKKSDKSSSSAKFSTKTTTNKTATTHHVKGVKVFRVHTVPSKAVVGSTFGFRGIVFNNSTATITFSNGTCTAPLSITFNKNVITEPQTTTGICNPQEVTLKPGEQSHILSPNLSGITYKATSPGLTNATMTFKYGAVTTSKSPISDSISRFFAFNILPPGASTSASAHTPTPIPTHSTTSRTLPPSSPPTTNSQPGTLKLIP